MGIVTPLLHPERRSGLCEHRRVVNHPQRESLKPPVSWSKPAKNLSDSIYLGFVNADPELCGSAFYSAPPRQVKRPTSRAGAVRIFNKSSQRNLEGKKKHQLPSSRQAGPGQTRLFSGPARPGPLISVALAFNLTNDSMASLSG